jgi:hypothetical protein
LPVLCIVMFAVGVQFLLMGLLAEMLVRTYHESQSKADLRSARALGFRNRSYNSQIHVRNYRLGQSRFSHASS